MEDECCYTKSLDITKPYTSLPGVDSLLSTQTWSCHRQTHESQDYCIFHAPAEEKEPEEVKESLLNDVTSSNEKNREFIGAKLGSFDIKDSIIGNGDSSPIDLRFAEFEDFSVTGSMVRNPLLLNECKFRGEVNCRWTTFEEPVTVADSNFASEVTFEGATFESSFEASGSSFEKKFSLSGSSVRGNLTMSSCEFHDNIGFWEADFGSDANFSGSNVDGYAAFAGATFGGRTSFSDLSVENIYFNRCKFSTYSAFFSLTVNGTADFADSRFRGKAIFDDATFPSGANFTNSTFGSFVSLKRIKTDGEASELVFENAVLNSGQISYSSDRRTKYDFTRATIGDLEVDNTGSASNFDNLLFNETDFNGFDFSDYRDELEPDWSIHSYVGEEKRPTAANLEVTYLKAKRGAASVGDAHAEAEFLIKEMKQRRRKYKSRINNFDDASFYKTGLRYVSNLLFDISCKYGESPRYVILNSISIILLFALVFTFLLNGDAASTLEASILSLQSFVALLAGQPSMDTVWLRIVSAMEAFLGSFLIALFVFTLTRSVHR